VSACAADPRYLLHAYDGPFVVQDVATGKIVMQDPATNWDAVMTSDHIVRVVGPSRAVDHALRPPRVEVWGPDLKLVTEIAVPMCAAPESAGG
jgi:hypothetical protein